MIVITTPTGRVGRRVLDALIRAGAPVRVIARDPARLPAIASERADVVIGSHRDPAVLDRALAGADALLWIVPPDASADPLPYYRGFTAPACDAIRRHGVARVLGLSSLGRGWQHGAGVLDAAWAMDALLERSGAAYRSLALPGFMDNMLWHVGTIAEHGAFFSSHSGTRRAPAIATADIAEAAVTMLRDDSWTGVDAIPLVGPEDLSLDEMAQIMSEVLGRPVAHRRVAVDDYRMSLLAQAMSEPWAQGLIAMEAAAGAGIYDSAMRDSRIERTTTRFREWCERELVPAFASETSAHTATHGPA